MHRKAKSHNSIFGIAWNSVLALMVVLLVLIVVVLFLVFSAQPAHAQNSVPATARQAATMPQFAGKLSQHPSASVPRASSYPRSGGAPASFKNPADARARGSHGWLPDDNVVYTNGPINGTTDAWTLNFGFATSNTFTVPTGGASLTSMTFGAWLFPGDVLQTAEVLIGTSEFDGSISDQVVSFTQSSCSGNQYGFNVCTETGNFTAVNLAGGTYWVTLENATVNTGDPVYWDENSGPSMASENSVGTIPSEAFTLLGTNTTTCYPFCEPPPPECVHDVPEDNFKIIHSFTGNEQSPIVGVTFDQGGKVYGATPGGDLGLGLAYQLAPHGDDWTFTSLYSFQGGVGGQDPSLEVIGPESALYGSADGGIQNCGSSRNQYCGVIYRLRPSPSICLTALCNWTEQVIYRFSGDPDGWQPNGNLVSDQAGNLYGTTLSGGTYGEGSVYELRSSNGAWSERIIYSFTGGDDGSAPSSLLLGHDGDLYGTNSASVFRLAPSGANWALKTLVSQIAASGLVQDSVGNLYFVSNHNCGPDGRHWAGRVFETSHDDGTTRILEDVTDDGYDPCVLCYYHDCYIVFYALAVDSADRLYVTRGSALCEGNCFYYGGDIRRVPWNLYHETLVGIGGDVFRDLQIAPSGKFYGTTGACGNSIGTVWQLTPP